MIRFEGRIVQFGFGAVGKSFYEKAAREIRFDEHTYFVISKNAADFDAFINLGGLAANFVTCEITRDNFSSVFGRYLACGDLLIDFADTVGTKDICDWCAENNIMYINTGDADWPDEWLNIFRQNKMIRELREKHRNNPLTNKHPIVLQHGNNPGLVSHFVKAGIAYIARTQHKKDKQLKALLGQNKYNEAAFRLGIKMVHVNDIDLQQITAECDDKTLFNTWCIDSFLFELLTEATINTGSHEDVDFRDECKLIDSDQGYLEFQTLAAEKKCRTYYPHGAFEGFLIPHEETVSIARSLEVRQGGALVYRPSVMFLYAPCDLARQYICRAKVNEYPLPDPAKPPDGQNENGQVVIRGYLYPERAEIAYREHIAAGTEYVGVLLMGDNFEPVWVGNRVEPAFLYRDPKSSYWQTPTITPVAMSALAAVCWMLKNRDKGGIYFPDDIADSPYILKMAEKYISKTIYKTFDRQTLQKALQIDFSNIQSRAFLVR